MSFTSAMQAAAVKNALNYLNKDPETNLPRLIDWMSQFDRKGTLKTQTDAIRTVISDPTNNWYKLIMSLWTDIEAGGRSYCHINANGDIEPCAFIHYSDSNIREKSLLESYRSPLFMGYHDNQPWNDNMLRPCPVLDNPGRLTVLVEASGAKSTDYQNLETAREFSDKCEATAAKWAPVADRLWAEALERKGAACAGCGRCRATNE